MESFGLQVLSVFSLLIPAYILLLLRNWVWQRRKLPPGPFGLPIVGSLLQIGARPHESLAALANSYGPLMSLKLGSITTIVASSPRIAKEILQKSDHAFAGRGVPDTVTAVEDYELSVVWLQPGRLWRTLRKLLKTHIMTPQMLDSLQGLRKEKMGEVVEHLREIASEGKKVNIGLLAFATTFNLLSTMVFSTNLFDLGSEDGFRSHEFKDAAEKMMELAGRPSLSDYFPLLRPLDLQGLRRGIKVHHGRFELLINETVDQRLRSRESGRARKDDLLDVLLDYREERGTEFDRRQVTSVISDLFIAGIDTIATTIEWVMAELLRNPEAMAKTKQELADAMGASAGRPIQESDVPRLIYLQAAVKEAMRLHPSVPLLLPHKTIADTQLCGFTIPKNTQVLINAWALARDPSVWEDPACFKPERFLKAEVDFRDGNFSFIPFGAGRRICPGMPLAVRLINLMVATLVHSFEWKLPDGMLAHEMDMGDRFGVTLKKAYPLLAVPSC